MGPLHFVTPWFFLGLLSVIIPILLLLTKAQTYRTTRFSSIRFLWAITKKASNSIEWKRLLLLATRILLLALIAFAFTVPYLKRYGFFQLGLSKRRLVFVLDNSYGMGYGEKGESMFERAKSNIESILKKHKRQNPVVSLYLFNEKLEPLVERTKDEGAFLESLREAKLSDLSSDFPILNTELKKALSGVKPGENTVYFFSDLSISELKDQQNFATLIRAPIESFQVEVVPIQPQKYRNFVLEDLILPPRPFLPGVEEEIYAQYQTFGWQAGEEVILELWVGDIVVQRQKVKIDKEKKGMVKFAHKFAVLGEFPLRVATSEPDALPADDVRYGVAKVHAPIRLLMLDQRNYTYPFESPYFYLTQAWKSFDPNATGDSWINATTVQLEGLSEVNIDSFDLVVLADVPLSDSRILTQLMYYVKEGGVVLFAPGDHFIAADQEKNDYLQKFIGGNFSEIKNFETTGSLFHLKPVDYSLPMLQIFDHGKEGDLGRIGFEQFGVFLPLEDKGEQKVLLWFENEWPALIEKRIGKGKLYLWTSTLNQDWSSFPKSALYLPFVFELLKYATFKDWSGGQSLRAGSSIEFESDVNAEMSQIHVRTPQGSEVTLYYDPKVDMRSFEANQRGFYEWMKTGKQGAVKHFVASNIDTRDSVPSYYEWKNLLEKGARTEAPSEAQDALAKRFFLYSPAFYLVFFLLIVEAWLANQFYKPGFA